MRKRILCATAILFVAAATSEAALFSGPSTFSSPAVSQLGPVTDNLVLTDTANGFFVSGQVIVAVPPGGIAGTLVTWTVDRPLDPTYGAASLITTTVLDGFAAPPVGSFGPTSGFVQSYFTNFQIPSTSSIPITLVNGAAVWSNIIVNSSTFAYTSGGVNFLRQRFDLDGVQISGPGGNWVIDVPVTTTAEVVPEPSSIVLAGLGVVGLLAWGRRRNRR